MGPSCSLVDQQWSLPCNNENRMVGGLLKCIISTFPKVFLFTGDEEIK